MIPEEERTLTEWQLHWLEAEGDLHPWRRQIIDEIDATRAAVSRLLPPPRLDVLIQRLPGMVIREIGMVGHAYRRSLFALTCDPDNENFARCLSDGTLRRQVAHEVHHCLRMGGPGYGRKLGEALVSEGLAGHFVRQLFSNPPEPWECALNRESLHAHFPERTALDATDYDHAAWFFGSSGNRPRWTGYTLGYTLVEKWLEVTSGVGADAIVNVPANVVLAAWNGAK